MRKALVSLGAGPQRRLLRLARTSFEPYAERHGYDLHLIDRALDPQRPAPWSKIVALRNLQDRYDLLLWLDADLVIVDGRVDIADELRDDSFAYLVEHQTSEGAMPNSGVLMLRTGDDCRSFLDWVWDQEDLVDHKWWENAAICRALGYRLDPPGRGRATGWMRKTTLLSSRWNSIHDDPAPRPRIRHYPGYSLKARTAFMARDIAVAGIKRRAGRG